MRPVTFLVGALVGGAIGATVTAGVALALAAGATNRLPGQMPRPQRGSDPAAPGDRGAAPRAQLPAEGVENPA